MRSRAFPLASELCKLGHEVCIFIAPYDNLADSGKELVREGVRIKNLAISTNSPLSRGLLSFRLASDSLRWSPDVIHVFKPKGLAGLAAYMLLRKKSVPLVLDCDDWEGWGGWNEVKDYSVITKQFIDWQERSLIKAAPVVTVASRVLETRAIELRRKDSDVFYIPNGVSGEALAAAETLQRQSLAELKHSVGLPEAPTILYVGHFDPADDAMFFARCTASVAAHFGATIAIVGEGPELSRIRDFFRDHSQARVQFFGRLPRERYLRVVAAADIATFPYPDNAVYRAKCSARIIDFMAAGKPILSSLVGQNPEYIINGESGILVAAGDEQAYRAALERLLSNHPLRERLGSCARHRARATFLWGGASTANCVLAYQAVVRQHDAGPRTMTARYDGD